MTDIIYQNEKCTETFVHKKISNIFALANNQQSEIKS